MNPPNSHFPGRRALCALLCAAALTLSAGAARSVPVQVDGQLISAEARLEDGVTYIPLRLLLDALGGWQLSWDDEAALARATRQGAILTADPETDTVTLDGESCQGSVYVENGRTYVPLRATVELLGGRTVWDPYLGGAAVTSPQAPYDAMELYWLSRVISAESQDEPYKGQLAVGNVVLHRVASDDFPDTIPAVVFDRKDAVQFEPVENGSIYADPAPASLTAALEVLSGREVLPGALYFYAPAFSKGVWINANRTYLTTIGGHRFYL